MIYLSIHGFCMRKITLGSRGPGNSLHCQWPWLKRVINLNLQKELRDLDLSFLMKSFIFSDVSTQSYLLRKHLILTYLLLFFWAATRIPAFLYPKKTKKTQYIARNLIFLWSYVHSSAQQSHSDGQATLFPHLVLFIFTIK